MIRLEHLCDMELAYQGSFTLLQPYGGEEGRGFGSGEGRVSGAALSGQVRWVNQPHRRSDGAMVANASGLILTEEQIPLLFSLQGRIVRARTDVVPAGHHQLAVLFEAEDERYLWLNQRLCVAEGTIYPDTLHWHLRMYVCLGEASVLESAERAW